MLPRIDYRNARYQGQIKSLIPHGLGILIDKNLLFVLAEWIDGEINGYVMAVYPNGEIFCGSVRDRQMQGIGLW